MADEAAPQTKDRSISVNVWVGIVGSIIAIIISLYGAVTERSQAKQVRATELRLTTADAYKDFIHDAQDTADALLDVDQCRLVLRDLKIGFNSFMPPIGRSKTLNFVTRAPKYMAGSNGGTNSYGLCRGVFATTVEEAKSLNLSAYHILLTRYQASLSQLQNAKENLFKYADTIASNLAGDLYTKLSDSASTVNMNSVINDNQLLSHEFCRELPNECK